MPQTYLDMHYMYVHKSVSNVLSNFLGLRITYVQQLPHNCISILNRTQKLVRIIQLSLYMPDKTIYLTPKANMQVRYCFGLNDQ